MNPIRGRPERITIGKVLTTWGVRGELKVEPITDHPERFKHLERVFLVRDGSVEKRRVESARLHKGAVLLKLSGIDSISDGEPLRGCTVEIPTDEAMPLPEGRYYVFEVVGLEVRSTEGESLGTVVDVMWLPANDVYVVKPKDPKAKPFMVPAVRDVVRSIDPDLGVMVISVLPGLIEG